MSKKLTPWFPPEIKPVHVGPYRVMHSTWGYGQEDWAMWDGARWSDSVNGKNKPCPNKTVFEFEVLGIYQDKSWRGLIKP